MIFLLMSVLEMYYYSDIAHSYIFASGCFFVLLSSLLILVRVHYKTSKFLRYGIALLLAGVVSQFVTSFKLEVPIHCNYYLFSLLATIAIYIEFLTINNNNHNAA